MIEFLTTEAFHDWCAKHRSDGFFVGYEQGYPPLVPHTKGQIPRMHRASCPTVPRNTVGLYKKCGSTDRAKLVNRFAPALEYCGHCHP